MFEKDVIRTEGLNFGYGTKNILKSIDIQVPIGSVYGYLGKNGSGKTTTIKLLLGLLGNDKNNIFIFGKSVKKGSNHIKHDIGSIIEGPCFYDKLTVYENLKYLDIIYGKGHARIMEVINSTNLTPYKNTIASKLSMGNKQRLGIGMSILNDPSLLILDEPLNGLDPEGVHDMRILFQKFTAENKTIFISSHILTELEKIVSHVGVLDEGKLVFQGTKNELLKEDCSLITVRVSEINKAKHILEMNGINYLENINETLEVPIYSEKEFSEFIKMLCENSIDIYKLSTKTIDLEQAYINLIN